MLQPDGVYAVRKTYLGTIPHYVDWTLKDRASWEEHYAWRLDPALPQRVPDDWADQAARRTIAARPDTETFVVAAGITPSGVVHIGNLREVITVDFLARALRDGRRLEAENRLLRAEGRAELIATSSDTIDKRLQEGELEECGLSISDLAQIRESFVTTLLTHWGRDRTRGERIDLPTLVKRQSRDTARAVESSQLEGKRPVRMGTRSVWPSMRSIQSSSGGMRPAISRRVTASLSNWSRPACPSSAEPEPNSSSDCNTKRSPTTRIFGFSPNTSRSRPKNSER